MKEIDTYASDTINDFLDFLSASIDACQQATFDIEESEREMIDLEHYIELVDCDAIHMSIIYKRMKNTRRKRRNAKETLELYNPIVKWVSDNRAALHTLRKYILSATQETEIHQSRRSYKLRSNIVDDFVSDGTI